MIQFKTLLTLCCVAMAGLAIAFVTPNGVAAGGPGCDNITCIVTTGDCDMTDITTNCKEITGPPGCYTLECGQK